MIDQKKFHSVLPNDEAARLAALQSYRVLDTGSEAEFDALTRLAAVICGTPIALVNLIDDKRAWVKARYGMEVQEADRNLSFCQYTILGDNLLEVTDTRCDERFRDNPYVTGDPHIRFYGGAPLINPEGYRLGSLCVVDSAPKQLTDPQRQALEILAGEVSARLELRRQTRLLEEEKMKLQVSERKYRELIDNTQGFIFTHDSNGNILSANPAAAAALGYGTAALTGKSIAGFQIADSPAVTAYLREVDRKGQFQGTTRVQTSAGEIRYWTYKSFRFEAPGAAPYVICSAMDVTEKHLAEQLLMKSNEELEIRVMERTVKLQRLNQELQDTNQELDTFLYRASHDLKGPLATFAGLCNVAKIEFKDPAVLSYFEQVNETAEKMNRKIDRLIEISIVRDTEIVNQRIDLHPLVQQIMQQTQITSRYDNFETSVEIDAGIRLYADYTLICYIFQNLFSHAIRFRKTGAGPRLHIRITALPQAHNCVQITFEDNGTGIPEEMQHRIFDLYYRGDMRSEDSGLGLYLVKKSVQRLKGNLTIQSEPGQGTRFTITLPADGNLPG